MASSASREQCTFTGGKSVQSFHNRLVRNLQSFVDRLALYQLRRHAAGRYGSTAAKGLELHIADDLIVIHIQIDSHDIAALGVAYGAYATGILQFSNVSGIAENGPLLFHCTYINLLCSSTKLFCLRLLDEIFVQRRHIA